MNKLWNHHIKRLSKAFTVLFVTVCWQQLLAQNPSLQTEQDLGQDLSPEAVKRAGIQSIQQSSNRHYSNAPEQFVVQDIKRFNRNGLLTYHAYIGGTDFHIRAVQYEYNSRGKLIKETSLPTFPNLENEIAAAEAIKNPGTITHYFYAADTLLMCKETFLAATPEQLQHTTTYEYNSHGHPIKEISTAGNQGTDVFKNDWIKTTSYDSTGHPIAIQKVFAGGSQSVDSITYDTNGNYLRWRRWFAGELKVEMRYKCNPDGSVVDIVPHNMPPELDIAVHRTYNNRGMLVMEEAWRPQSDTIPTATFEYNDNRLLTRATRFVFQKNTPVETRYKYTFYK